MKKNKELLIEKYVQITGSEPIVDEWMPRIKKMLSVICKGRYSKEQIVATHDSSILSNGNEGIVFTTKALCVKDSANSTKRFIALFKDIAYCHLDEDSIFGVDISALELHMHSGEKYRLSTTLFDMDLMQMQELIEFAMTLNHDEDDESDAPQNPDESETWDEMEEDDSSPAAIFSAAKNVVKELMGIFTDITGDDLDDDEFDEDWLDDDFYLDEDDDSVAMDFVNKLKRRLKKSKPRTDSSQDEPEYTHRAAQDGETADLLKQIQDILNTRTIETSGETQPDDAEEEQKPDPAELIEKLKELLNSHSHHDDDSTEDEQTHDSDDDTYYEDVEDHDDHEIIDGEDDHEHYSEEEAAEFIDLAQEIIDTISG